MCNYYSVDDVATMTMLSTRTIRNYIKQGFLDGEKIEGVWQFSADDLEVFFKNDYVRQSLQVKKNAMVYDYMLQDKKQEAAVCSIYDYPVKNHGEEKELRDKVLEKINSNAYGKLQFSYECHKSLVRIILIGDPKQMALLMKDIE